MNITASKLLDTFENLKYPVHPSFNLFAIRNEVFNTNTFNDIVGYIIKVKGEWQLVGYECTTDPGFGKGDDEVPEGTAMYKAGYYKDLFTFGYHKGNLDHPCLKQTGTALFYVMTKGKMFDPVNIRKAIIGANLHSTKPDLSVTKVFNFSKACIVVRLWASYLKLLSACGASKLKKFSFALITEKEYNNAV